jgi:hypothetical protein
MEERVRGVGAWRSIHPADGSREPVGCLGHTRSPARILQAGANDESARVRDAGSGLRDEDGHALRREKLQHVEERDAALMSRHALRKVQSVETASAQSRSGRGRSRKLDLGYVVVDPVIREGNAASAATVSQQPHPATEVQQGSMCTGKGFDNGCVKRIGRKLRARVVIVPATGQILAGNIFNLRCIHPLPSCFLD